jgi:hypothetical protein
VAIIGSEFRLYASQANGGEALEQFVYELYDENRWFTLQETPELQALERLWGEKHPGGDFHEYSHRDIKTYFCRCTLIAKETSSQDLVNAVVAYIQYLRNNLIV